MVAPAAIRVQDTLWPGVLMYIGMSDGSTVSVSVQVHATIVDADVEFPKSVISQCSGFRPRSADGDHSGCRRGITKDKEPTDSRFYVIAHCKQKPELVGIHSGSWPWILQKFPKQCFFKSGAKVKRHADLEFATSYYTE